MTPKPTTQPAEQLPYGHHIKELRDVSGFQAVAWDSTEWVRVRMLEVSRRNGIIVITGNPGVGKSFTTARAAEACIVDRRCPADVVWVEFSHAARGRALLAELYPQITGSDPMRTATIRELRDDIAASLAAPHRLLVLDEAQHVGSEAMRVLRWLMDQPLTDAALAIVGLPAAWRTLAPEMRSRALFHLAIDPIGDDEVAEVLAGYHPLFAGSDEALLAAMNKVGARGRFRWWAHFLALAAPYAKAMGKTEIDEELARVVRDDMPDGA